MTVLVIGNEKSGKSDIAESKAIALSMGEDIVYLATMIPMDAEGEERVRRHRKRREGKGFLTIECPFGIERIINEETETAYRISTCLLECVSNLVGNEMHRDENKNLSDTEIAGVVIDEIKVLKNCFKNLVIVTNIFEKKENYSDETIRYIDISAMINDCLINMCDEVMETTGGIT